MTSNKLFRAGSASLCLALSVGTALGAGALETASASTTTTTTNDSKIGSAAGSFSYSGSWSRTSNLPGKYLGDDHFSSAQGASYTYRFSGNSLSLFAAKAPHHGRAEVRIDGGAPVIIDQYSASRQDNVLVYQSPALAAGQHVATVTVTGSRSSASTGTVVSIDRAVATTAPAPAPAPAPTGPVTTNDSQFGTTAPSFSYLGTWARTSNQAGKFQGDDHYSGTTGSSFTYRFSGTEVELYGAKAPHHGQATVQVDGGAPVIIDQYSPTRQDNVRVFRSANLPAGQHTVTVTVRGTRNAAASGRVVSVDRAVANTVTTASPEPAPTTAPAPAPAPTTSPAPAPTGAGVISRSGDKILRDGQPWWFVGHNSFVWSGNCGHDFEKMSPAQLEQWFASLRQDGHSLVRLFFFRGWDINRLDHALKVAKQNNIYLAITVDDAIAGCGTSRKDSAWFSNANARAEYKNHLGMLLNRYKGEPQIAWFEYFNEPGSSSTFRQLRSFYDEMGAFADTIDPTRLFSSGTVAPYWLGDNEGGLDNPNFRHVHESPGVDIASLHEYDENEVVSNHFDNVRANAAGKPVWVGEFGIKASPTGAGCSASFGNRAHRLQAKGQAYITTPGGIGGAVWAWTPNHTDCSHSTGLNDPNLIAGLKAIKK